MNKNTNAATLIICLGCIAAAFLLPINDTDATFKTAALIFSPALAVALMLESLSGFRALLRTDILMLVSLYGLTLLEFLFPQPSFDKIVAPEAAVKGTEALLWGFAGIALGRHLVPPRPSGYRPIRGRNLSPKTLFTVYLGMFALGYLYIFMSVNFDLIEVLRQMTQPRFTQSWSRGRLGGWLSLLTELGLLIYLLPPIAGVVFAREEEYKTNQKIVVAVILAFTFFYGFSGGTRSVFITYLLTFVSSYLLFRKKVKKWQVVLSGALVVILTGIAVYFMLEFRTTGIANYSVKESKTSTLFVDNNIVVISRLTDVFPDKFEYMGLEIPYNALIRPIPRALWPGKPEGLSVGIEEALGATGLTLAATFVGESYLSGGMLAVVIASVLLGAAAGWWNRLGRDLDSDFKLLLFVSGFFGAALAMRSILQVVPALLPTLALWTYGRIWLPKLPHWRKVVLGKSSGAPKKVRTIAAGQPQGIEPFSGRNETQA